MKAPTPYNSEAISEEEHPKLSLWKRYKQSINFKSDLKAIFFRSHKRYATLDGARAITILLMVMFHVLFGIGKLLGDRAEQFIADFPSYLMWMWQAQGSDPLFVVCGLLVSYTLFREYDKEASIDVWRFFKRRMMRIYPLLIIAILLFLPTNDRYHEYILSNLTFTSNYFMTEGQIVPVGWSLEVQMHFYFMLPFICLLMYAIRWRVMMLVSLCVASVGYRYWLVLQYPDLYQTPFYEITQGTEFPRILADKLYYDLDARIGAFFMGMLVAYLHHYYGKSITEFFKNNLVVNFLIVSFGIYIIAWSFSFPIIDKNAEFYKPFNVDDNIFFLAFNRYAYSFGMSVLLLVALCPAGLGKAVKWFLSWAIWHPFAQLIYAIYLFHFIFIVIGAVIAFGTTDKEAITSVTVYQVFAVYFWALLLTTFFSVFAHIFIEKPFLKLRES